MNDFHTDLENRLSKVNSPAMPADVESRIRQRLSAQMAKPRRRFIGFLPGSPAFATQAALLAALIAIAAALIAHDSSLSAGNDPTPPPAISAGSTNYVATFSVPTVKVNSGPAPVSNTIAPPEPPRKHH
jgi:hypothetical protein